MVDLSKYILQALYEATGQTGAPVDIVATLYRRWPQISAADVRSHSGALSARGHVMLRLDGTGAITGSGIRTLSEMWSSGAFGPIPAAAQPYVDRLHAVARAHAEADEESSSTRPYSAVHVQRIQIEQQRTREVIVEEEVPQEHEDEAPVELVHRKSALPESTDDDETTPMPETLGLGAHMDRVRAAVLALTQEISAATNLSMDDWSAALELTAQLDGIVDQLGAIVADH